MVVVSIASFVLVELKPNRLLFSSLRMNDRGYHEEDFEAVSDFGLHGGGEG
jgi:hypothetical protein